MQNKDKASADSLFTKEFQAVIKASTDNASSSFYDTCVQSGEFCTSYFSEATVSKYDKKYQEYTAKNGTKGKQAVYTASETSSNNQGANCNSKSTTTMTIALIPSGSSWLIDNLDQSGGVDANLCPAVTN